MIRTQIQFEQEQLDFIKDLADRENTSMSAIVRRAVDALAEQGRTSSAAQQRARAIEAAGKFASGRSDVAEKHDEYLAEAYRL